MPTKHFYLPVLMLVLSTFTAYTQRVAINEDGSAPNVNAILDLKSPNKGVLFPRLGSAARMAIPNTRGLVVFDTTTNSFWYNSGTAWINMAPGPATPPSWSLTGNSGLSQNNFLGTVDNAPLLIRVNNQFAGRIDAGINTTFGNTFWGYKAGMNTPLISNSQSLSTNNTGIGFNSLLNNTTGHDNTALGHAALFSNTIGLGNVAVGTGAMGLSTGGSDNVAIGRSALGFNSEGNSNVAIGMVAMVNNSTGRNNIAIGFNSFQSNTTGQFNTVIGSNADVAFQNLTNATAIGNGAFVNASNKVRIGNSAVTAIEGQVPFTTPSDGRFKSEIREDVKGLDFVLQLRPVTYHFDARLFDNRLPGKQPSPDSMDMLKDAYRQSFRIRRSGFIAQEVERAATNSGYEFSGLLKPASEQDYYSLSYESFVVPLVKAVQELHAELAKLKQEKEYLVTDLQKQISELKQLLLRSK